MFTSLERIFVISVQLLEEVKQADLTTKERKFILVSQLENKMRYNCSAEKLVEK